MEKSKTAIFRFRPGPGLVVAEKVRLEKLLSRGGMGSVWIGRHLGLDLPVAVKFMSDSSPDLLARFQREARAAAQIRSSNVVKIHDFGVDRGTPYIVMELLEGEDLGARLRRVGRLSLAEAASILIPIARGLDRAHEARLVHRDLKPENIFLAREGEEEIPKILDFGVAKAMSEVDAREVTEQGAVLGTPHYMSPEQARSLPDVDHRADLWSLGVILFLMVTGQRPFNGRALAEVLLQIISQPVPRVGSIDPALPQELDRFFERALARDREQRFQSAKELARAFSAIADMYGAAGAGPVPVRRTFDSTFDASGALGPIALPTSHTGPAISIGPSSSQATAAPISIPASGRSRGKGVGIAVGIVVLVLGGVGAFLLLGRGSSSEEPASASRNTIPQPSAAATPSVAAAPEPLPAPTEEPAASAKSPLAGPASSEGKTVKPPSSGATKKPARDLGY